MRAQAPAAAVIWQDVECGAYTADLPLWEELAGEGGGAVLELGCGCGRVALRLARDGHEVTGIDSDPAHVEELRRRAAREGLELTAEHADAAGFALGGRFASIVAPMQLIQLLPDAAARRRCLDAIAAHLAPGGTAALAIVEGVATGAPPSPALPDVLERGGWVYSSLPLGVVGEGDAMLVERLRQTVDPGGSLHETRDRVRLRVLSAAALEGEARQAGLRPAGRRSIEGGEMHVESTVVVLRS